MDHDTRPEVQGDISEKYTVRDAVKRDPLHTHVGAEKRDGNRQYEHVDDQHRQHEQVPEHSRVKGKRNTLLTVQLQCNAIWNSMRCNLLHIMTAICKAFCNEICNTNCNYFGMKSAIQSAMQKMQS